MKRYIKATALLLVLCTLLASTGCAGSPEKEESAKDLTYPTFTFTHYASGGVPEEYEAVILFEQSNSTFTAYQVAFASCTCRDPMNNYMSVAYVEILNNRDSASEASVRYITFGEYRGLFGDGNRDVEDFTEPHVNETFVSKLIGKTYEDLESWGGYGSVMEGFDVDALTGATVTTSNITSMLLSLMKYHTEKYYKE